MAYICVDVESDGPIPGDYSMICFGAVHIEEQLSKKFYGVLKPISEKWLPKDLSISGFTREETLLFDDPRTVMIEFKSWLQSIGKKRLMFISDNNGYDWSFINWYFWHFLGENPLGYSSGNISSLYKGMVKDTFQNFRHLSKTKITHHPVDDATSGAEAVLAMKKMGLKILLD